MYIAQVLIQIRTWTANDFNTARFIQVVTWRQGLLKYFLQPDGHRTVLPHIAQLKNAQGLIAGIDAGGRRHDIQDGHVFKPVALHQHEFEGDQPGKGIG
ncbi:hypothetical protein D3C71_1945210 [compost metagenome]